MAWKVGQSRDLYKYIFVFFSVAYYLSERFEFLLLGRSSDKQLMDLCTKRKTKMKVVGPQERPRE